MSHPHRKHRGYRTQAVAAEWFRNNGFPYAEPTGAGRQGIDITGMPGLAPEVKAVTAFDPLAWVRQATKAAGEALPFVISRRNGQGETTVGDWLVILRLYDFTHLVRAAGHGDPEPEEATS